MASSQHSIGRKVGMFLADVFGGLGDSMEEATGGFHYAMIAGLSLLFTILTGFGALMEASFLVEAEKLLIGNAALADSVGFGLTLRKSVFSLVAFLSTISFFAYLAKAISPTSAGGSKIVLWEWVLLIGLGLLAMGSQYAIYNNYTNLMELCQSTGKITLPYMLAKVNEFFSYLILNVASDIVVGVATVIYIQKRRELPNSELSSNSNSNRSFDKGSRGTEPSGKNRHKEDERKIEDTIKSENIVDMFNLAKTHKKEGMHILDADDGRNGTAIYYFEQAIRLLKAVNKIVNDTRKTHKYKPDVVSQYKSKIPGELETLEDLLQEANKKK